MALGLLGTALLFPTAPRAQVAAGYTVVDLGKLSGGSLNPLAINNSGVIVGTASPSSTSQLAFRIDPLRDADGTPISWFVDANGDGNNDLARSLAGLGGSRSEAADVNEAGDVVGQSQNKSAAGRAVMWRGSQIIDLTGKNTSSGAGINNLPSPQVTGSVYVKTSSKPYLWQNGTYSVIGAFLAYQMNDAGQVTGQGAGLYSGGVVYNITPEGNANTTGYDINQQGQVVGEVSSGSVVYPFLWTPDVPNGTTGTCLNLGSFGGSIARARGINNGGQVVGGAVGGSGQRAFVWNGAGMIDLNTLIADPTWVLIEARRVNDQGLIIGRGGHNGGTAGFLLIPNP